MILKLYEAGKKKKKKDTEILCGIMLSFEYQI